MSATPPFPEPKWLADVPEAERPAARLRWVLGIAASYYSHEGTLIALSRACDKSDSTLGKARHIGAISPKLVIAVERAIGRDIMPREFICPEIFSVEA